MKRTINNTPSFFNDSVSGNSFDRSTPPSSPSTSATSIASSNNNSSDSTEKTCAICLGNVTSGQGQALFTAECSHSFHFSCIANNVQHGNHLCPICRFQWKQIPFQQPSPSVPPHYFQPHYPVFPQYPVFPHRPEPRVHEPLIFSDDEPLLPEVTPADDARVGSQNVTIKSFTEFPAIAASNSVPRFAVLVGLQAPPLVGVARTPIDLVTVLDVSGSMGGSKLTLLKQAVHFVIDNLGASDRLAIVSFSSNAQRIFPLSRMTDVGRENAKRVISSLIASGGTNIVEGLKKGARVLEERREMNPVASIILLSDGQDTCNSGNPYQHYGHQAASYLNLLPASINSRNGEAPNNREGLIFPVHTFGFGLDHDSSALHAISDASDGTYSFIQSVNMVQDAFARCIGGLLSVVAQELHLSVKAASPGVKIGSIPSGRYTSEISEQGSLGVINVGDLYAEEVKEFIIYLSVPAYLGVENDAQEGKTPLLDITCSYKDSVSNEIVSVEGQEVEIRRPRTLSHTDSIVSVEVDRQMNRLRVAETLAESRNLAEMGNLSGAQAALAFGCSALQSSASAQAGDNLCNMLEAELFETKQRMASREIYQQSGRAYVLSGLSSHSRQRATSRGDIASHASARPAGSAAFVGQFCPLQGSMGPMFGAACGSSGPSGGGAMYQTAAMSKMVKKSQDASRTQPPK